MNDGWPTLRAAGSRHSSSEIGQFTGILNPAPGLPFCWVSPAPGRVTARGDSMAISSVSSTNPLDQLAQSLVARFDANQDGQLTTDEFTSFLSSFLNSIATGNGNALGLSATSTTSSGPKQP